MDNKGAKKTMCNDCCEAKTLWIVKGGALLVPVELESSIPGFIWQTTRKVTSK